MISLPRGACAGLGAQILGADVVFEHDSEKTLRKNISVIHAANTTFTTLVETLVALTDPVTDAHGSSRQPAGQPAQRRHEQIVLIAHKHRYLQRERKFHDMMAR